MSTLAQNPSFSQLRALMAELEPRHAAGVERRIERWAFLRATLAQVSRIRAKWNDADLTAEEINGLFREVHGLEDDAAALRRTAAGLHWYDAWLKREMLKLADSLEGFAEVVALSADTALAEQLQRSVADAERAAAAPGAGVDRDWRKTLAKL